MKRTDAPVEGAPVAGAPQKVVNNFITNNITNNYNVRVKGDDGEARRWFDAKTGLPRTNVANVTWQKNYGGWQVQWVDAATKKTKTKLFKGYDAWEAAVRHRAEAQATEGRHGPGALRFTADGEAIVACGQCHRTFPLAAYAPEPCKNKQAFATFARCCAELGSADARVAAAAEAALAVMPDGNGKNKALRTSRCRGCRDVQHKSQTDGDSHIAACRAARDAIRADMAARGCRDCDDDRDECLECEHVGRRDKPEGCESILEYKWFAAKYKERGPEEMWKAYRSPNVVVLCKRCHVLQPTHDAVMGADSSTLEDPKAKRRREYREAKTAHNNARKRSFVNPWPTDELVLEPGVCLYCDYRAVEGTERAFDWMHCDENLKTYCISELVGNGQSPATAIPRMDAEIDGTNGSGGCRLGCKNCHFYYETLPRSREGTEKWDELMATPVRKRVGA